MKIVAWLLGTAPTPASPPPPVRHSSAPPRNPLPPSEPDIEECPNAEYARDFEDVYAIIEYRDAKGQKSRRRVTLRSVSQGPSGPILTAICHERRAIRHFRCDRIECFIDPFTGEISTTRDFFRNEMSFNLDTLTDQTAERNRSTARRVRDELRPALSLLVAAARADDEFHASELDAIMAYAEREAALLMGSFAAPVEFNLGAADALGKMISRLRPQRDSLENHLLEISAYPADKQRRFYEALAKVIDADGRIRESEVEFVLDMEHIAAQLAEELRT